jgi:hypothetical protein
MEVHSLSLPPTTPSVAFVLFPFFSPKLMIMVMGGNVCGWGFTRFLAWFAGVGLMFKREQFATVNGFSNNYYGWGYCTPNCNRSSSSSRKQSSSHRQLFPTRHAGVKTTTSRCESSRSVPPATSYNTI